MGKPGRCPKCKQSMVSPKPIYTGDDPYLLQCFTMDVFELPESRDSWEMPEAQEVVQAGNSGNIPLALAKAEALRDREPDYFFPYFWLSLLSGRQGDRAGARQYLLNGLKRCRQTHALCTAMGKLELEAENLPEAAHWWIKSICLQCSTGQLTDHNPFLYLSYVASAHEQWQLCDTLLEHVDRIHSAKPSRTLQDNSEICVHSSV